MGQALYRKHRPKKLSEVIGQEHITHTLGQALKTGKISHAYLFTGPRGTGKTSIARIMAHEINGFDYAGDQNYLDIIEIDAASNRRIDEIRDLRDKVYIAPTTGKYKVYIIDEVHMLTREAFNALLKTLEEPPEHAIFILATTEVHKLPETIISRTQRYTFKPVELDKVVGHLRSIADQEKINASDDALKLIAEHGEGSFRDSISLLDQAGNRAEKVDLKEVQSLLGIPPHEAIEKLASLLDGAEENPIQAIVNTLNELYGQGYQASAIAKKLSAFLRHKLINQGNNSAHVLNLLTRLIEVPSSHDPARYLEIVLLEALPAQAGLTLPALQAPPKPAPIAEIISPAPQTKPKETPQEKVKEPPKESAKPEAKSSGKTRPLTNDDWQKVLNELKKKYNTLYSVVRIAQPRFEDNGDVELALAFAFHHKRLSDAKNNQILASIVKDLTGRSVAVRCVHNPDISPEIIPEPASQQPTVQPAVPSTEALNTISNIFGGGELLES